MVELTDVWTVFFREVKIGLLMGVACGFILTGVGWAWHQAFLGMVVGTLSHHCLFGIHKHGHDHADRSQTHGRRSGGRSRTIRHNGQRYYGYHDLSYLGHGFPGAFAVTHGYLSASQNPILLKGRCHAARKDDGDHLAKPQVG